MLEPEELHDRRRDEPPRASLLAVPGELCRPGVWMGGAHTPRGTPIAIEAMDAAWVVDLAGDLPTAYRQRASRWVSRVFADLDAVPRDLEGLRAVVSGLVAEVAAGAGPEQLYVFCQHGMNRSGLVSGLVLRELGLSGAEALARIVEARPGALSNLVFRQLVEH
ncbi:MAG: hypothetical protein WEC33_04795 [Dehalococcoidia bacterium]